MKSYLQRLAARAEGVALTPSLVPTGRSNTTAPADTDSFFTEAEPGVAGTTEAQSRNAPIVLPLEADQFNEPMPTKRRSRRTTALHEKAANDPFGAESVLVQPKLPVREAVSTLSDSSHASKTQRDQQAPHAPVTQTNTIEDRPVDTSPGSFLTPSSPKATEEPAGSNESPVVFASKEPAAPLEPRLVETTPVPVPDEPRLVIGQLRVDVIATAQTQAREVVRVVSRAEGSNNRSRAAGPGSKLRFGLGQM